MLEKMHLFDHYLTQTRRTSYNENMDFVALSCINFALSSVKQKSLNKQGSTRKNTRYK